MADISKVKLPDGNEYDIKDAVARASASITIDDNTIATDKVWSSNKINSELDTKIEDNPTFTEASTRANIDSGESFSTILGKIKKFFSDLKTVAFSGSYNDLSNTPTIPMDKGVTDYGGRTNTNKIKININATSGWMLCFTVTLYQGYRATKVMISGYNYGTNHWYQPEAVIIGDSDYVTTLPVYFGYDSNNHLWVGFDGNMYTGVHIDDVTNGYDQISDRSNLFTISNVSSLSTLQTTINATSIAGSATKATQDGNGNNIVSTYATKAQVNAKSNTLLVRNVTHTVSKGLSNGWHQHLSVSCAYSGYTPILAIQNKWNGGAAAMGIETMGVSLSGTTLSYNYYSSRSDSGNCTFNFTVLYIKN